MPSARGAVAVADSILNVPPGGVDPDAWEDPFRIGLAPDLATADAAMAEGVAEERDDRRAWR